jgi:proteic killer suppression protein
MLDVSCQTRHGRQVIVSFATRATERFAREGKSKFAGLDVARAMARLQVLHAAASLDDIPALRSIGLHALSGNRQGQWAMTINGPWRLVFRFRDGNAENVEIVDYH